VTVNEEKVRWSCTLVRMAPAHRMGVPDHGYVHVEPHECAACFFVHDHGRPEVGDVFIVACSSKEEGCSARTLTRTVEVLSKVGVLVLACVATELSVLENVEGP